MNFKFVSKETEYICNIVICRIKGNQNIRKYELLLLLFSAILFSQFFLVNDKKKIKIRKKNVKRF